MKKFFVLLALFVASTSFAWTLSWDPVTTYTDNTVIGPDAQGVFYNVEMDNVMASGDFLGSAWIIPAVSQRSSHTFRVRTVLGTGEVSAWTPPFPWTSPGAIPNQPQNLRVAP